MTVVQLSNCFECKYKAVWVDAGIHAREWIAPATALFALSQLAENETSTAEMREHQDWFILPVANPDGYEFTHKKDRMWRKTRSNTSVPGCYGADPNRNFDFHWNEIGASSNPCSETYAGRKAFSEIEALNIRNFLYANKERFKLYISYHAYGNRSVAEKVNAAMVQAGSQEYTIGSSTQVLYPAAGGSDDWAKGVAGIPLSYTIELPGFDFGFQLPPSYIDQVARQSFEGLRVFAAEAKKDRLWRKTRSKTWWGLGCAGADANRNFDFHWREVGASWSACSYTYAGSKAFSEPEARAVRDYLLANKDRMKMYLTYHSYGNFLLYPWGYTSTLPNDWKILDSLAKKANKAMVAAGSDPYTIGSSTNVLYAAAGGSDDWAKGVAGIELSYTIELPGGNGHGFDLPASYIPDVGRHQMELIKVFGDYVASMKK
ncbi:Carboxypeptidase [Frankliniella occidentalis]|nr:Carboxypeptidase [Frankliniella occidentalis]